LSSREINEIAVAHSGLAEGGHRFRALIASQQEVNLRIFLPGGGLIGPPGQFSGDEHGRIIGFFGTSEEEQVWVDTEGETEIMHGFRRVSAVEACVPCHTQGETLAVATMSTDLTRIMERVRLRSRRNLGLLIVAWATMLGGLNMVVRRSIRRSAERLEERLAAAEAGELADHRDGGELVLDPASAWLYGALGEFLDRQRERQEEMASRLEHTDQLAALGQLAAGLAHEIKNPLAGIQGALEILSEDTTDRRTGMLYTDMLGELQRVNTTLQLLLESARPSPPRLALTDPEVVVGESVSLLRPGFSRRGIELRSEYAPDTKRVRIDSAKIRQVLINLIQNAAEAMDSGGTIIVRAGNFPERDGLILAVEDDGPGISEEHRARIFEPFYTTKFTGTGLGLAISKRLVEQHGGTLEVDSEVGRGTTFYVLLPATSEDPTGDGLSSSPAYSE
jgi:signal transduction histidine kinase